MYQLRSLPHQRLLMIFWSLPFHPLIASSTVLWAAFDDVSVNEIYWLITTDFERCDRFKFVVGMLTWLVPHGVCALPWAKTNDLACFLPHLHAQSAGSPYNTFINIFRKISEGATDWDWQWGSWPDQDLMAFEHTLGQHKHSGMHVAPSYLINFWLLPPAIKILLHPYQDMIYIHSYIRV